VKRKPMHQVVPAAIMAGAVAVPVVTTVEILTHVAGRGSTTALQPSGSLALAPSRASSPGTGAPTPTSPGGARTYQGPVVNDPFGGVQATVTVSGKKITDVTISAPHDNPRSSSINQQAAPLLRSETLQAQSAQINGVSGATLTSQAYAQSLQTALDQARQAGNAPGGGASSSQAAGGGSPGVAQAPSISGSGGDD